MNAAATSAAGRNIRVTPTYGKEGADAARPYQRRADAARRSWSPYFLLPYLRWT